jgi:hypothetical protein
MCVVVFLSVCDVLLETCWGGVVSKLRRFTFASVTRYQAVVFEEALAWLERLVRRAQMRSQSAALREPSCTRWGRADLSGRGMRVWDGRCVCVGVGRVCIT